MTRKMPRFTKKQARAEVSRLREEIRRHDHLYYAENNPEIPDADYDKLMRRLVELERDYGLAVPDSPSQRVAGEVAEQFNPFSHVIPMMSIDNAVDEQETREFDRRIKRFLKTEEEDRIRPPAQVRRGFRVAYLHRRSVAPRSNQGRRENRRGNNGKRKDREICPPGSFGERDESRSWLR